jgi:hypothetical protein
MLGCYAQYLQKVLEVFSFSMLCAWYAGVMKVKQVIGKGLVKNVDVDSHTLLMQCELKLIPH